MSYIYADNVSPRDRFQRLEMQLDSGTTAVLQKGNAYDLSSSEIERASRFIVLLPSSLSPSAPEGIVFLPIKGTPLNGQVPVWSASDGAFVPAFVAGGGSEVGSGIMAVAVHNGTSYPSRPTGAASVMWIGPTPPPIGGATGAVEGVDLWTPTTSGG